VLELGKSGSHGTVREMSLDHAVVVLRFGLLLGRRSAAL
jgi:hypothetical protein